MRRKHLHSRLVAVCIALVLAGATAGPAQADFPWLRPILDFAKTGGKAPAKRAHTRRKAPVPETVLPVLRPERPQGAVETAAAAPVEAEGAVPIIVAVPLPAMRPERNDEHDASADGGELAAAGPQSVPAVPLPTRAREADPHSSAPSAPSPARTKTPPPQAGAAMALAACLAGLQDTDILFVQAAARSDPLGCDAPHPLEVARLPGGIALSPPAVVNCDMARALAQWSTEVVQPAAQRHLGTTLTGLSIGASYVCRKQASGRKLSEHAFANAVDVMGFVFADGSTYSVGTPANHESGQRAFNDTIRRSACNTFTTVLGPGADADHSDHLHLDLRGRGGGYRICQ